MCLPGPNPLLRLRASANTSEHWGLLSLCHMPSNPRMYTRPGLESSVAPNPWVGGRLGGRGGVPAASQGTSWLRATLSSMPQSHQVVEATSESRGGKPSNQPARLKGANQQADSSFPSPRLTLALTSADLISWWWEKAKQGRPSGPFALVLRISHTNYSSVFPG